jgi:acetoin:2,6-dichlorophenolindophenol oxidoreductase subunit beta
MTGATLIEAARQSLAGAMAEDERVLVLGEDATEGGPFGLTKGLAARFGVGRVRNTPISEASFMGVGIGLALGGAVPLVDIMFDDFLTVASDQLFNHAAKLHYMSGGRYSVPLVVWTVGGAGTRWAAQHSQRLDGWLTQIPGLKVLAPSSPKMAASSVAAALADPDPVVVLVDRTLLFSRSALPGDDNSPWEPRLVRRGSEVTVATTGRLTHMVREIASNIPLSVELIDLQRLHPFNADLVCASVEKTGHLVIAHDEVANGAFGASALRSVYERAYWHLDGPVILVSSPATPVPAAPVLEDAYVVREDVIRDALMKAVGRQGGT